MTIPTDSFTLAAAVNGFLVLHRDGSHESIPVQSDRFRVIAEGAWLRVIATGARLYRTFGTDYQECCTCHAPGQPCRPERVTDAYADSPDGIRCTLDWDLCEHYRFVEEARKAIEVAA